MNSPVRTPTPSQTLQKARTLLRVVLYALLPALYLPAGAAPAEGTSGQTVTGRALSRADGAPRSTGIRTSPLPKSPKPAWTELSAQQQMSLQPLAADWERMSEARKRKWLLISKNYPKLSPEEQAKLHRRMSKWASLNQHQRTQARMSFKEIKTLSPRQKAAQWEAYQALSAEEKRRLAAKARSKPAGVATIKPASSRKLTHVPRHRHVNGQRARLAEASLPARQSALVSPPQPRDVEPDQSGSEDEETEE